MNQPDDAGRIALRQDVETPLKSLNTPFGTVLYFYNRSSDSIEADVVGQDYVTFRFDATGLTFAVCDGVGQSFIGDLAARLLGDYLIDWLWEIERPGSPEAFSVMVAEALNEYAQESAQDVADYELPGHLPPIVNQALELQREYGSEAMFVTGRINLQEDNEWIALAWLGDAPVAAIDIDGELLDLSPRGHTSERWNATTGTKGEVHTWVSDAENVARVAGYTDGLGVEHVPTDADLAALIEKWIVNPPIDDASLFDVRLRVSPLTVSEFEPPISEKVPPAEVSEETDEEEDTDRVDEPDPETVLAADNTRPIPVPGPDEPSYRPIEMEPERTPVADVAPLRAEGERGPIGEWRPLQENALPEKKSVFSKKDEQKKVASLLSDIVKPGEIPDATALAEAIASLEIEDSTKKQQMEMWQQAALLGLTSAALAMLMVERLVDEGE